MPVMPVFLYKERLFSSVNHRKSKQKTTVIQENLFLSLINSTNLNSSVKNIMAQSTNIQRFLLMFCCCYCTFAVPVGVIINPGNGISVGPVTPIMSFDAALNLFIQAEHATQMSKTIEDMIIVS